MRLSSQGYSFIGERQFMTNIRPILVQRNGPPNENSWPRILLTGLLLYVVGVLVLVQTRNVKVFPSVVMLGNFLIPVVYVMLFYDNRHLSTLSMPTTAKTFFYGGVLGVFASAILEPVFVQYLGFRTSFVVGLIEELAKVIGILIVIQGRRHDSEMDGLILGAAAGMGFAALESTGYAFSAFFRSGGSLSEAVAVTMFRGLLAPLGHGTWTAILAAVLFRESFPHKFRVNPVVIGTYLMVAALHGLWNAVPALFSHKIFPGMDVLFGQAIVGGIGLMILWTIWNDAVRRQALTYATKRIIPPPPWTGTGQEQ